MPLDDYRRKRDFAKTPEPSGDRTRRAGKTRTPKPLYFCVQKHLASRVHYDLRLEHDAVLLSWAVPKGSSLDPRDKHMAVRTEDHQYDYDDFEEVIPEGYGAGVVTVWDTGIWQPEVQDIDAALDTGDLKFTLDGYTNNRWASTLHTAYASRRRACLAKPRGQNSPLMTSHPWGTLPRGSGSLCSFA